MRQWAEAAASVLILLTLFLGIPFLMWLAQP
jgi:hypothetical protein